MTKALEGKVALVTGGSRGIGAAIAKRLGADGASIVFTYASAQSKADDVVKAIEAAGGRALAIRADSADVQAVRGAVAETVRAYAMTKAALAGLTRGLSRDLGPRGITVNNVQPGPVNTEMNPSDGAFAESLKALMALNRYGWGEEIAAMVA
jgi:NAD(P)-dependent dehydrogenase (short-subunit alcohol dehydrogenase family)